MCVCIRVRVQNKFKHRMKLTIGSSAIFKALLVAALFPVHGVCAYRILMIPLPARSHVFSLAAIAEGLARRGHRVTFFVGENYRLNLPELRNQTRIDVVRYTDMTDGVYVDYDAFDDYYARAAFETESNGKYLALIYSKLCVHTLHGSFRGGRVAWAAPGFLR